MNITVGCQLLVENLQNEDRVESAKAGGFGALGGSIALAPLLLTSTAPAANSFFTFLSGALSCGLFGITYR